jgi:hypothetical protein
VKPSASIPKQLGFLAATILLVGCQFFAPAKVKNCAVKAVGANTVSFAADFLSSAAKPAQTVRVLVTTVGDAKAGGGSVIEYRFDGHYKPGEWYHGNVTKAVNDDPFNLASHVAPIYLCQVHMVEYEDGTNWLGPSQL